MSPIRVLLATLAVAPSAVFFHTAVAADGAAPQPPPAQTAAPAKPLSSDTADQMARMDRHMNAMRQMHDRMMRASTPDERQALMAEHMKAMREGMSMMGGMSGRSDSSPPSPEMMQKQIEMMRAMMQMMLDRMDMAPPSRR